MTKLEADKWTVYGRGIFYLGMFQLINKQEAGVKPVTYWSSELLHFDCICERNGLNRWLRASNKDDLEFIDPKNGLVFPISAESIRKVESWGKCIVLSDGTIVPLPYNFMDRLSVKIDPNLARRPVTSPILTVLRIDLISPQETVIVDWRARRVLPKLT